MQQFVETERLILRELLPSDEAGMFELGSDPEVQRFLGNKPVKNTEQIREVIKFVRQQYIDNGIGRWAMIEKSSGNFIGWTGLKLVKETINNHNNYYDIGYRLIRKYWGKGYATESAKASLDYGFNALYLTEIFGTTDVNNKASGKILEKIGLTYVETFDYEGIPHNWFQIKKSERK